MTKKKSIIVTKLKSSSSINVQCEFIKCFDSVKKALTTTDVFFRWTESIKENVGEEIEDEKKRIEKEENFWIDPPHSIAEKI